jgi:SAM-dependent methyltransferase
MYPSLLPLLKCPDCSAIGFSRAAGSRRLACESCGREFETKEGYLNLLDRAEQRDLAALSPEQRLMESELIANIYERLWRPTFVRIMAGSGASANAGGFPGELFIHKNCLGMDERSGPWLDLSCGPGLFTRAMAASAPGALIVGLDISRAMLEVAARRVKGYSNVILVRADAHSLPFADEVLSGVNNSGALHSYDDPKEAFKEVLRVLRPGGVYVASTFSKSKSVLGRFAARIAGIRRFEPPELQAQLSRTGFADYEEIRLGEAFIFKARKP